ncbi:MAG TPA: phage portal protein [Rheinheimera sp.]|nr:phage portal protein [Rheinheimera sp.]
MSIFSNVKNLLSKRADPLENPQNPLDFDDLTDFFNSYSSVSEEAGMKLSAVYSCINVLSSNLAQLPLHVMRRNGKNVERATDHPAYDLLHLEPNALTSSYDWRETSQAITVAWGNSLTKIKRNKRGEIESLHLSNPHNIEPVLKGGRLYYRFVNANGDVEALESQEVLHVRAFSAGKQMWSKSVIRQNADAISLGQQAVNYGNNFFSGGGRPTGILSAKGDMSSDQFTKFVAFWNKVKSQLRTEDNKTVLLPNQLEYKSITIPPEDAQFIDSRKLSRSEIAGIFNVPAHMINDLEKASFSNITESSINFLRYTMMPWIVRWEQEMNRKIFTSAERKAGYYVQFNVKGLLRATPKEQSEIYSKAIQDGYMNRNEIRSLEDLNPVDGLDEFLISVNASQSINGDSNE